MSDDELELACDRVMKAISELSAAADTSKQSKLTRLSSDLYYAANRAWRELYGVRRRQKVEAS
jgi:hypothetical protein